MSQLVIRPDMTTVYSTDGGSLGTIAAFATQRSTIESQDRVHRTQNVYVHSHSPNTGDAAVTSHSPYAPGPPFEYQMPTEKIMVPLNDYPGDYGFEIYFGEKTASAPKSAQYTYSTMLNKLFVKMNVTCPIQFKCNLPPPQGCIIKATPVFKRPQHMKDIVTRCPNHKITDNSTPSHIPVNHLVRVEMPSDRHTVQYNFGADGRESVSVLYEDPQVGTDYSTVLFKFMCLSSCVGGINRRPLVLVFTFENVEGQVLGRRVVEIRICSCPGRDRAQEEKRMIRREQPETTYRLDNGVVELQEMHEGHETASSLLGKRKRHDQHGRESDEYILRIRGRDKYDTLRRVKEALDLMDFVPQRQREMYRVQERDEDNRLVQQIATKYLKREHDQHMNGNLLQTKPIRTSTTNMEGFEF